MKRMFVPVVLFIISLALSGCFPASPAKNMAEIYIAALDAFMPIDEGLNHEMQYIAVDMSNFKHINERDKQQILYHFKSYGVEVMEATYEQLEEKGLLDAETRVLSGVLLSVEKTGIQGKRVVVEGSKMRAGNGAIGVRSVVEYSAGQWKLKEAESTWIS